MGNDERPLSSRTRPDQESNLILPSNGRKGVEARLARATDPREIVVFTQVRGELIRQDEAVQEGEHRRRLERIQLFYKLAVAPFAVAAGIGLVVSGFSAAGLFVIGAGLSAFTPDYVRSVLKRGEDKDAVD